MKFVFSFLFLLATSSVYSNVILGRDSLNHEIVARDACEDQMKEYNDCLNENDLKGLCSSKCKKLFDDPAKALSKCGDQVKIIESGMEILKNTYNVICATDGGGNACPFTQSIINNEDNISSKDTEKIIEDTCKSKLCTDALVEYFKSPLFVGGDTDNEVVTKLNSKECRDKNSARGLKIGGSLLLTFVSLLFYLFM
ncbi:hypothetical protein PIROE2DRAFT_60259 [Piromyces sp. E2]|nr:hypothetical protein PIROE2DRAFT_60259 [Piromyces sp. E2]|eukprot:OUM65091.1 hypothetical protein PIROE2DRAFT_60259 [Piromyces sp. E2]